MRMFENLEKNIERLVNKTMGNLVDSLLSQGYRRVKSISKEDIKKMKEVVSGWEEKLQNENMEETAPLFQRLKSVLEGFGSVVRGETYVPVVSLLKQLEMMKAESEGDDDDLETTASHHHVKPSTRRRMLNRPLIQKVPFMLSNRSSIKKYYVPKTVSFGPLHYLKHELHLAEKFKRQLAKCFVKACCPSGMSIRALYDKIIPPEFQKPQADSRQKSNKPEDDTAKAIPPADSKQKSNKPEDTAKAKPPAADSKQKSKESEDTAKAKPPTDSKQKSTEPEETATKLQPSPDTYIMQWRKLYEEGTFEDISYDRLALILLVDGCAVLFYILWFTDPDQIKEDVKQMIATDIAFELQDLFLLENQIPFEVLKFLMENTRQGKVYWMDIIKKFIGNYVGGPNTQQDTTSKHVYDEITGSLHTKQEDEESSIGERNHQEDPIHLLGLTRDTLVGPHHDVVVPPTNEGGRGQQLTTQNQSSVQKRGPNIVARATTSAGRVQQQTTPSKEGKIRHPRQRLYAFHYAQELKEAGIKLTRSQTSYLKDRAFSSHHCFGKLELPPIIVDEFMATLFYNLIAYERLPDFTNDYQVTAHICFLDTLIGQVQDVAELRAAGILYNRLGRDDEVCTLFHEMAADIIPFPDPCWDIQQKIDNYFKEMEKNKLVSWLGEAMKLYFRSPWTVIAFLAGAFTILVTVVQTYFTIFPLKK
ncbi:hypothetical protein Tsubulata_028860 [Turnera subulata]|uniref:Uncharacterized protein n=1 Tax=Turnera subulata TaxID=218843 RepID=A0A9Q0JHU1_9ROSI|nr:hypothetical protein Tsubulata_028860 [Turnera subulata]